MRIFDKIITIIYNNYEMIGARTTSAEIISFVFDGLNLTIKRLAELSAGNLGGTAKGILSSQYIL